MLDETAIEIRKVKKIIFIGYSFPEADVHIKALFRKNLKRDTKIHVIDPSLNDTIKSNYKNLSKNPIFYEKSFGQFITEDLVNLIESH